MSEGHALEYRNRIKSDVSFCSVFGFVKEFTTTLKQSHFKVCPPLASSSLSFFYPTSSLFSFFSAGTIMEKEGQKEEDVQKRENWKKREGEQERKRDKSWDIPAPLSLITGSRVCGG